MNLFAFFRKKAKPALSEDELKWNRIWDLWAEGNAESPYAELMTYEAEVNNGGHFQYFDNTENCGDLKTDVSVLLSVLPEPLKENLRKSYIVSLSHENINDDAVEDPFEKYDEVFYRHEQLLIDLLKPYAERQIL